MGLHRDGQLSWPGYFKSFFASAGFKFDVSIRVRAVRAPARQQRCYIAAARVMPVALAGAELPESTQGQADHTAPDSPPAGPLPLALEQAER